jgi:hypothetical protein
LAVPLGITPLGSAGAVVSGFFFNSEILGITEMETISSYSKK